MGWEIAEPVEALGERGQRESVAADFVAPWAEPELPMRVLRAALAVGVTLRVLLYLSSRSLWLDEACLALNLAGRSYLDLLRPLDYDQVAPPLFLWAENSRPNSSE